MTVELSSDLAWKNLLGSQSCRWGEVTGDPANAAPRLAANSIFLPSLKPKSGVPQDAKFFCIGSCFARNIEEHLIYREYDVLSRQLLIPKSEWDARPNGITNKFTTPSILQELRWAFGDPASEETIVEAEGGYVDLQLAPGAPPVTRERALERRAYLADYFRRSRDADVIIITLGYIEVWFDIEAKTFLNTAPSFWTQRKYKGRYTFHIQSHSECLADLERIHRTFAETCAKPPLLIVTVSPVPLQETFSGDDIVLANRRSKSTLVSAATEFAANNPNVVYFPSFEIVTETPRARAFASHDLRHVYEDVIGKVVETFLGTYGIDRPLQHPSFREVPYLRAYPDVYEGVRLGLYRSGYEHWCLKGQREGRHPQGAA